jgi:hypothetical protein
MLNKRSIVLTVLGGVVLSGAALVTLRAAEQATRQPVPTSGASPPATSATAGDVTTRANPDAAPAVARGANAPGTVGTASTAPPAAPAHPAPSVPEESATIPDDPTTAPDPSQSADNNVSFPNDI